MQLRCICEQNNNYMNFSIINNTESRVTCIISTWIVGENGYLHREEFQLTLGRDGETTFSSSQIPPPSVLITTENSGKIGMRCNLTSEGIYLVSNILTGNCQPQRGTPPKWSLERSHD